MKGRPRKGAPIPIPPSCPEDKEFTTRCLGSPSSAIKEGPERRDHVDLELDVLRAVMIEGEPVIVPIPAEVADAPA